MSNFTKSKTKLAAAALAALAALAPVAAQQPQSGPAGQSVKGAELKGKAPVSKEILKVNLPKAQEATLSNGLRVVLLENRRVPTFTMQMVFLSAAGSRTRPTSTGWHNSRPPCCAKAPPRARARTSASRLTRSARP